MVTAKTGNLENMRGRILSHDAEAAATHGGGMEFHAVTVWSIYISMLDFCHHPYHMHDLEIWSRSLKVT